MYVLDESKLKILELLRKPMTVTEIAKEIGLSKATVSHHLKILERLGLVKVAFTEVERNFIRKYFVSKLYHPEILFPQEEKIFRDFTLSREEFLRTLLRLVNVANLDSPLVVRKIGFDFGYFALADRIDDFEDGLAKVWEKLKLGKVVEVSRERFVVEDCYNCAGLPKIGKPYCKIDEGIIEGVLRKKSGKNVVVEEVKCWGTGYEVCEFEIRNATAR